MNSYVIKTLSLVMMLFMSVGAFGQQVREVRAGPNDIITINTSPGLSTLIEFEGRPRSVIVGDLDAFKVEYAGSSLAIKPLIDRAKSNLFVATEMDSFRFRLRSSKGDAADYVVRVKVKRKEPPKPQGIVLSDLNQGDSLVIDLLPKSSEKDALQFSVLSLKKIQNGDALAASIQISIGQTVFGNRGLRLHPDDFHVFQMGKDLTIKNFYLNSAELSMKCPLSGLLIISREDVRQGTPLLFYFSPKILGSLEDGLKVLVNLKQEQKKVTGGGDVRKKKQKKRT